METSRDYCRSINTTRHHQKPLETYQRGLLGTSTDLQQLLTSSKNHGGAAETIGEYWRPAETTEKQETPLH